MSDFEVSKFYAYRGPSFYLDRPALVFNLSILPDGPGTESVKEAVLEKFPIIGEEYPERMADLGRHAQRHGDDGQQGVGQVPGIEVGEERDHGVLLGSKDGLRRRVRGLPVRRDQRHR